MSSQINESIGNIQNIAQEVDIIDSGSKITETTVLVHSPAINTLPLDTKPIAGDVKFDLNGNNEHMDETSTDVIESSVLKHEDKKSVSGTDDRDRKHTMEHFYNGSTTNVLDKIKEESSSPSHVDDTVDDRDSIESIPPARKSSPTRTYSSTSYTSRKSSANDRGQGTSSRASNVSFNSQMGMNEVSIIMI